MFYIAALETASPRNQHCANCIGTRSFSIHDKRGKCQNSAIFVYSHAEITQKITRPA